jgi:integrase
VKRHRVRLSEGVYADQWGISATVKVGGVQRERRFPPNADTDLIKRWRAQARAELEGEREASPAPVRGTFADDLPKFLKQIAGRVAFKSDRSHLRAWLPHVGALPRNTITPAIVRATYATWQAAGKSARTIRHRHRVLRELYQTLDGAHARPPLQGVKPPRPEDPHPTPVALSKIQAVAASLKAGGKDEKGHGSDSEKGYARFLVRATTGQRPSQIMRAEPGDVDLVRRIWFVRAGKGGRAVPLPLNADMVKAWRAFIAANAWGPYNARSFSKLLRRHGWPKNIRPYNLRHTFAIDHLLAGTDIGDLQGLLGHKQVETTRRFYGPVLLARLTKASSRRKLKLG